MKSLHFPCSSSLTFLVREELLSSQGLGTLELFSSELFYLSTFPKMQPDSMVSVVIGEGVQGKARLFPWEIFGINSAGGQLSVQSSDSTLIL